jgi:hypothetical protein
LIVELTNGHGEVSKQTGSVIEPKPTGGDIEYQTKLPGWLRKRLGFPDSRAIAGNIFLLCSRQTGGVHPQYGRDPSLPQGRKQVQASKK